jgi:hypothetical protein
VVDEIAAQAATPSSQRSPTKPGAPENAQRQLLGEPNDPITAKRFSPAQKMVSSTFFAERGLL